MADDYMVSLVKQYKFSRAYFILESYGYFFKDSEAEGDNRFLIMSNGKEDIRVVPNKYFGCKITIGDDYETK